MIVEVWSDVVCPWCFIGKRRFEQAVARLADDPDFDDEIEIVYRPYQLDPSAPPGTTMPVVEAYARKFGGRERAESIIASITATAAEEGLDFHLERAQRANTRDAHRLLQYALDHGPEGAQGALKERLLRAYFTDGLDVSDPDVLADAAEAVGLDRAAVVAHLASEAGLTELAGSLAFAAEAEITAVPTYVIGGQWAIPGAQDPDTFVQVIKRLAATQRAG
jgi:predicted DsbA family dithiol-disulfide isomerase